jgi:LPXTG-motif cell wall-anchored protein
MLVLKYAFVSLSLGATLVAPSVAMACNTPQAAGQDKKVTISHNKDNQKSDKDDKKTSDKDDQKKSDNDNKKDVDNGGKGKDCAPTPTPAPTPAPTPVATPTPTPTPASGQGSTTGTVLSSATTPVAQAAAPTTLPDTGSSDSLVFVVAGGTALGAFLLAKYGINA